MRKGWFTIPGLQLGERTLDEQLKGLEQALAEAPGKSVCDIGCAEGLIAMRFAEVGARSVWACDNNEVLLKAAADYLTRQPEAWRGNVVFEHRDVRRQIADFVVKPEPPRFDIVLALAIAHKMGRPDIFALYVASLSADLAVFRLPGGSQGVVLSKHTGHRCNLARVMESEGFRLQRTVQGPRDELVQYYRRQT